MTYDQACLAVYKETLRIPVEPIRVLVVVYVYIIPLSCYLKTR
jgi:hypothetical protein